MRGLKAQSIGKRSQPLRYHLQDRYQMRRSIRLSQEFDYVGRDVDDVGEDFTSASLSLRQGLQDLGTWKGPLVLFIASQREVGFVNVFSYSGGFCETQVIVSLSSSVAAGRRATTVGAAGAEAGVLFRFQKVKSGRSRLSRRISSVMTQHRSIHFSGISLLRARRSSSCLSGTGGIQ